MSQKKIIAAALASAGSLFLAGSALAQTSASATTDLNIRSGPGPQHSIIGVVESGGEVTVNGCLQGSKWCTITSGGGEGWVYSDYLTADLSGSAVVLTERYADVGVPVVTYEDSGDGAATGAAAGAVTGAIVGGPIGAVVGGVAGAVAGGTADEFDEPSSEVRTYVTSNQIDPVYLDGEVVVGATLPETVELREIPQYEYRYVYVNGQPVIVEPSSRRILYVVR